MSLGFLTLDIIIILVLFIGTFLFTFTSGKKKVVKFMLAIYPALLIFNNLPFEINDSLTKIGAFIGVYFVVYSLFKKNFTAPSVDSGGRRFLDSTLISIASLFMLLTIYYKVLPIDSLYSLSLPFSDFLIERIPFYITLIIPILIIFSTNRRDY
jgi:hypothetical protein